MQAMAVVVVVEGRGGRSMHNIAPHTITQPTASKVVEKKKLRNRFERAPLEPKKPAFKQTPTHCSSPAPTLDKDLDDISCGGQSPWDAIIGGSSDHYATAHTISRTQYIHNMFASYTKWIIIPTEWRTWKGIIHHLFIFWGVGESAQQLTSDLGSSTWALAPCCYHYHYYYSCCYHLYRCDNNVDFLSGSDIAGQNKELTVLTTFTIDDLLTQTKEVMPQVNAKNLNHFNFVVK